MTRATVLWVAAVLVLAPVCRADESGSPDLPLPPVQEDNGVAPLGGPRELPAADLNKNRETPDAEPPATKPEGTPPQAAAPEETDEAPCPENGRPGHVRRLWQWLTYRPLERPGICGCCHHCVPYCNAPLYAFFPCYGGYCGAAACACNSPVAVPAARQHRLGSHLRAHLHRDHGEADVPQPVQAPASSHRLGSHLRSYLYRDHGEPEVAQPVQGPAASDSVRHAE